METKHAGPDWRFRAACLTADPELFFPLSAAGPSATQLTEAKAICARCPVRRQCLDFALTTRQVHGVWGGTSEDERRRLLTRRHRPRRVTPDKVAAVVGRAR
jgi:WhiB family transcriptional regulator, redox-sensing transcriptional regulator